MVYNLPTGYALVILDDGTTAMTGMPEHPACGRSITVGPARSSEEDLAGALGARNMHVTDGPVNPRFLPCGGQTSVYSVCGSILYDE